MISTFTKIKLITKKLIVILVYTALITSLVYGVWYAIKNRKNGNNPLLNFVIGIFDGVLRVGNYIISKWSKSET